MIADFYNLFLGIDPGLHGGLALVSHEGGVVTAGPLPLVTRKDKKHIDSLKVYQHLRMYIENIRFAAIEHVHAMPKQGVTSTFTFGKGFGMLLAVLEVLGIPYHEPTPQSWKKELFGSSTPDKAKSIEYAKSVPMPRDFIHIKRNLQPHDGVADAICLARFARKYHKEHHRGRYE